MLTERLRHYAGGGAGMIQEDCAAAADEIERLRVVIEQWKIDSRIEFEAREEFRIENERLRAALRAAGINLITASNTIERLGDLQDAEATRRMAKQILPLVNEQNAVTLPKPTPDQEEYLRKIQESTGKFDPNYVVGGPKKDR